MAFTESASDGTLNSTTEVTVVASPATSTRRLIRSITIQNRDTADVTLTVRYKSGASTRQIWKGALRPNETWIWGDGGEVLVLDATNKSIAAVLAAAVAANQPDYTAHYGDAT